ncbi:MAG: OmpA family protein [Deltaproteobacteria bacterium]|nr:OmpA family protein [Deltaproteobacteria bacterium]
MRSLLPVLLACSLVLPALSASPARANDVDLAVSAKVYVGEKPKVTLKIKKDLAKATLEVDGGGGQRHRQTLGPGAAGTEFVFELPQKGTGVVKWKGTLEVEFDDGSSGTMPLTFATEVIGKLDVKVVEDKEEIVGKNTVRVTMSRKAGKVDVEVVGDDGETLANVSQSFSGEAPGTELKVEWIPKTNAKPFMLRVVAHDPDGIFSPTREVYLFDLAIPHEEVLFESGKSEIRSTEEPKLQAALVELNKQLEKYRRALAITKDKALLAIIGHTDTVGSASSNEALSLARARSIGQWFRKHGVRLPLYAAGNGERDLKVNTPDETDNAANRRADYEIQVHESSPSGWVKIP